MFVAIAKLSYINKNQEKMKTDTKGKESTTLINPIFYDENNV